jgi:menaquinone-dependent protoporphyrinogen oxidase
VFYATTEGHTRLIADRLAERLRRHGLDSHAVAIVSEEASHLDWRRVRGAAVAASLHMQKHQPEATAFARLHRAPLSEVPSLFISVSLAAASKNADERVAAERLADAFPRTVGWTPWRAASVAGCLAYTRYHWLKRLLMRRIAGKEGGSLDTTRDHVYTDWQQVDSLGDALATAIYARGNVRAAEEFSLPAVS